MFFFDKFEFTVGDSFKSFVFMERAVILNIWSFVFPWEILSGDFDLQFIMHHHILGNIN